MVELRQKVNNVDFQSMAYALFSGTSDWPCAYFKWFRQILTFRSSAGYTRFFLNA